MSDTPIQLIRDVSGQQPAFELGDFVQDRLTNYCGKLVARTEYLYGQTSWGMLSAKALRPDLGGLGLVTPQVYDWLPEERLEPISADRARDIAERIRDAQDEKEQKIYRAVAHAATAQTHSGKFR